ncbi:Lrp/AsnC family transcriptional regulator [Streptomyces sp. NPDC055107]
MADGGEESRRAAPATAPPSAPAATSPTAPATAPASAPSTASPGPGTGPVQATEPPVPPARPLDAIDRDILRILQTDGRASIRSVAERVHVSRANAYARINRLVEDGVIRGFGARVDHERAGQGASAYITLKIVQNSWRTVREQLQALPGATHIALVSGDFDVLLLVHTPDNRALRELVLTRIQSIPEVLSTRTLLVFEETDLGPRPDRPAELA